MGNEEIQLGNEEIQLGNEEIQLGNEEIQLGNQESSGIAWPTVICNQNRDQKSVFLLQCIDWLNRQPGNLFK